MEIESLGDAFQFGYRLRATCAWGKRREGLKSVPVCVSVHELDVETMLWTHGSAFPVSALKLKCPRCGSRIVTVALLPPAGTPTTMPVRLVKGAR